MSIQQMLLGASGASGYQIDKSVRLRASASAYLNRTPASAGNQKTWTWSGWVKRGKLGAEQNIFGAGTNSSNKVDFRFNSNDTIEIGSIVSNVIVGSANTAAVFRDPSAWYHIVLSFNVAATTVTVYVNGVSQTLTITNAFQNTNGFVNSTSTHFHFGTSGTVQFGDGYLAEVNFIDGQALTPASFGSTSALTGVWQPAPYTGTYGTNGFYLDFEDTSSVAALGTDSSGNGNTWTVNNVSLTAGVTYDSMTDVPTLTSATAANYAVLNPLNTNTTLSDGNLKSASTINQSGVCGSISLPYSKIYFEYTAIAASSNSYYTFGVIAENPTINQLSTVTNSDSVLYSGGGNLYRNTGSGFVVTQTVAGFTAGDILACAVDLIGLTIQYYKNGVAVGTAISLTSGVKYTSWITHGYAGTSCVINFGQRPFSYTPPTGFVALNTFNLPTATILKGSNEMDIALDTGANIKTTAEAEFTGSQIFEWIKDRANANNHQLLDSVRGLTAVLQSNTTAAETTYTAPSGNSVGWVWKAGASAVSNTDGTITSQVSANTSAGFSVVTYTGDRSSTPQTVGHGLGIAPKFIIFKSRSNVINWLAYHQNIANTAALYPNLTDAAFTTSGFFNNTSPTSSVFTINTANENNGNAYTMVAYCWAEIEGFSKFGLYIGNGSADGTFVYTGFRPRWILIKRADISANWIVYDTARDTFNAATKDLFPNSSTSEIIDNLVDVLSNGFKLRQNSTTINASGGSYIYAAFAENPFKQSLAR